ncbi:hypothetical protein VTL71DRAFT_8452 [Oculimacula yallundae]|uniref:Cytochrome P450 n=1 Tax=Oculimacula yallundae TaxID=86028 RepID=A0ABR4CXM9_9HELO
MDKPNILVAATAILAHFVVSPIPEVPTVKVLQIYSTANIILFATLLLSSHQLAYSIVRFSILNLNFVVVATLLTFIRRLYFSPLSHFPGPKLAALSNAYLANAFRHGRAYFKLAELHEQYKSDFIRIGPNQLSISNVAAVEAVFRGKYPRGTFYDAGTVNGAQNLLFQRDYSIHTPWRRIWDKAFASSELQHYNPRVEHHVDRLVEVIKKANREEVNCTTIMDNLSFDIMADLAFANEAGLQAGTGDNQYIHFIHKTLAAIGIFSCFRNLAQLVKYIPEVSDVKSFRVRGEALLAARQRLGTTRKDVFSHLIGSDTSTSIKFTQAELNANAQLVIIAGSDTTSATLTQTLRILAKQPAILKKLQAEVDDCASKGALTVETTRNLPYLNAVVNESLRLYNVVPLGSHAASPPLGLYVAGTFIPGNVQIDVPHGALMVDPRYFEKPLEYIPERWTDWSDGVKDRRAFIPFGYGAHSCVGKQLALNELRTILTNVVKRWDVVLGEKYNEQKWNEGIKDYGVLEIGELWIKFVPRAT